jgi:hypothetical protein
VWQPRRTRRDGHDGYNGVTGSLKMIDAASRSRIGISTLALRDWRQVIAD